MLNENVPLLFKFFFFFIKVMQSWEANEIFLISGYEVFGWLIPGPPTGTEQSETLLMLGGGVGGARTVRGGGRGGSRTQQQRWGGCGRQPGSPPTRPLLGECAQVLPLCAHLHVSYCI